MTLQEAIIEYSRRFDKGPPIWNMEEAEAIRFIESALAAGRPLEPPVDPDIPPGAFLSPPEDPGFSSFYGSQEDTEALDRELTHGNVSRQCLDCINLLEHSHKLNITCLAFPEGIPEEIITGEVNHSKPYPGDNGFRYRPILSM